MRPTTLQALTADTYEPIENARQLAATRCLLILRSNALVADKLHAFARSGYALPPDIATQLVIDLLEHGATLRADLTELCALLGVQLVEPDGKAGA